MILRRVAYHSLPNRDNVGWIKANAPMIRGVSGLQRVEFIHSTDDPNLWGALMYFDSMDDLTQYKTSEVYKSLLQSLTEALLDPDKPVIDGVFDIVDL
jgi:hypothetical protein